MPGQRGRTGQARNSTTLEAIRAGELAAVAVIREAFVRRGAVLLLRGGCDVRAGGEAEHCKRHRGVEQLVHGSPPGDESVGENGRCLSATPPAHVHLRVVAAKRDVRAHKEHALGAHLLPFRPRRIADLPWCCAAPPLAIGAALVGPRHKMIEPMSARHPALKSRRSYPKKRSMRGALLQTLYAAKRSTRLVRRNTRTRERSAVSWHSSRWQ